MTYSYASNAIRPLGRTDLHLAFADLVETVTSRQPRVTREMADLCRLVMADPRICLEIIPGDLERDLEDFGPLATYGQAAEQILSYIERIGGPALEDVPPMA